MSYFLTISGASLDVADIGAVELVEAARAQSYISTIAAQLAAVDGPGPVFLIHDGETGTSHELIGAALDAVFAGAAFGSTDLAKVLSRAAKVPCTVRLWDAGAVNPVTDQPLELHSSGQLLDTLAKMAQNGHIKYVRYGAS